MKILVLSTKSNSKISENHKDYCKKYNYDYLNINTEKLFFDIKKYLNNYDYIFYINCDLLFFNKNIQLENIINEYKQFDLIFSKDLSGNINLNSFFVKNTNFSYDFLSKNDIDLKSKSNITIVNNNIFNTYYEQLKNYNMGEKCVNMCNFANKQVIPYDLTPSELIEDFIIDFSLEKDKDKLINIFLTMEIDYYTRMRDLNNDPINKLIAKYTKNTDIVLEIGTYVGLSTKLFSKNVKHIDTVDKFMNVFFVNRNITKKELFDHVMSGSSNYNLIVGDSKYLYDNLNDNYYDLIYLDGDHSYAGVKYDIINLLPKLKINGYICGHDYCEDWSGVKNAVDELLGQPDETFEDTSWVKQIKWNNWYKK